MKHPTKEKPDPGTEKKHMKWVLQPFFMAALVYNRLLDALEANGKRYASLFAILLFFVLSSSFSFPVFEDMEPSLRPGTEPLSSRRKKRQCRFPHRKLCRRRRLYWMMPM